MWHCPYPVDSSCLCGFASILMYSGWCVALPLSCLQRLLVRLCFHVIFSGWCVALPLSCLQRLLVRHYLQRLVCGFVSILCTAVAFIVSLSLGGLGCYPGSPLPAHLKYSNSFWTVGSPFLKYYSWAVAFCFSKTVVPFERLAPVLL